MYIASVNIWKGYVSENKQEKFDCPTMARMWLAKQKQENRGTSGYILPVGKETHA